MIVEITLIAILYATIIAAVYAITMPKRGLTNDSND
jgi:hypothetical protein